jgi:DNA-binding GntR family transcriptional regulator
MGATRVVNRPLAAKDRAYQYVKGRVLDGTYQAGQLLSEGEVAEAIGMSRTPAREAFLRLEGEGLLRLYPKRGALVVPVSAEEIEAVLETRELIENHAAAKLAAVEGDLHDVIGRMAALILEQRSHRNTGDYPAFVAADRAFHWTLVASTENRILSDLYQSLRDRQLRMGLLGRGRSEHRMHDIEAEHQELLDKLSRRDVEGFRETLARHLEGTRHATRGGLGARDPLPKIE